MAKIVLAVPGHLKTVPMSAFSYKAFAALGHEVHLFDFGQTVSDKLLNPLLRLRAAESNRDKPAMNRRFMNFIDEVRPDIFVNIFGFDFSEHAMQYVRSKGIPSACWWINDPFQFERSAKRAHFYDFIFSNSSESARQYRTQVGMQNAYFLPTACDPDTHAPTAPNPAYACDVCFAGDWSPLREELMLSLCGKVDLKVFGPWAKKLAPDSPLHACLHDGFFSPTQMAQMFSNAAVVLNIHTWYREHAHGLNPRLFEASGCGAFQLVDWKQEIPQMFAEGTEIQTYRDITDVAALVADSLKDKARLRSIGEAARQRALAEHTYAHRMSELVATVGRAG